MSARKTPWRAAIAIALAAALLPGCGRGGGGGDSDTEAAAPNPVLLVSAAPARVEAMTSELRLLGRTAAMRHVIIRAPTAGRVVGMKLTSGDVVRKGQIVAHVINREIEAAEAGLAVTRKIDPQDAAVLAESVHRYNTSPGIPVVAPDTGVVSQPPATNGQIVGDLDPLVDLVEPASLYVDASVPIGQLHLITPGMPVTVTTPLRPTAEIPARVAAVMPIFDATSASSSVRMDFTGRDRIAEIGAPVEVRVETARVADAIAIPTAALFQDAGADRYHVFAIGADGRARRTAVTLGVRNRDRVQITVGLKAGDLVITSGGYSLSDGLSVRVAGGGQ